VVAQWRGRARADGPTTLSGSQQPIPSLPRARGCTEVAEVDEFGLDAVRVYRARADEPYRRMFFAAQAYKPPSSRARADVSRGAFSGRTGYWSPVVAALRADGSWAGRVIWPDSRDHRPRQRGCALGDLAGRAQRSCRARSADGPPSTHQAVRSAVPRHGPPSAPPIGSVFSALRADGPYRVLR